MNRTRDRRAAIRSATAAQNRDETHKNAFLRANTSRREERAPAGDLLPPTGALRILEETPQTGKGASRAAAPQEMALLLALDSRSDGEVHARQNTASASGDCPRRPTQDPLEIRETEMEVSTRKLLENFGLSDVLAQENCAHASVAFNEKEARPSGHSSVQRSATKNNINLEKPRVSPPQR